MINLPLSVSSMDHSAHNLQSPTGFVSHNATINNAQHNFTSTLDSSRSLKPEVMLNAAPATHRLHERTRGRIQKGKYFHRRMHAKNLCVKWANQPYYPVETHWSSSFTICQELLTQHLLNPQCIAVNKSNFEVPRAIVRVAISFRKAFVKSFDADVKDGSQRTNAYRTASSSTRTINKKYQVWTQMCKTSEPPQQFSVQTARLKERSSHYWVVEKHPLYSFRRFCV